MKKLLSVIFSILIFLSTAGAAYAEQVVFNTKTLKYHKPGCQWAIKCTQNCIKIEKQEAVKRGGVPCKVCGG